MADWCLQSNFIEPRSYFDQDEINELRKYVTTDRSYFDQDEINELGKYVTTDRSYFDQDEINELWKYVTTGNSSKHVSTDYTKFSANDNSPKTFAIKDAIFNPPATIVLWEDGAKTVVKCQNNETYSKEVGLAMCICKKVYGNKSNYNNIFKKFIKEY